MSCAAGPGWGYTRSIGWRRGVTGRPSCARSCMRPPISTSTATSTGWILLRGKTFFQDGPNGRRATRSIGLIVDITDRKRGEEANALHASTVHSSSDAIFSIDPDLTIKTWNGGAERLYGFSAAEAI